MKVYHNREVSLFSLLPSVVANLGSCLHLHSTANFNLHFCYKNITSFHQRSVNVLNICGLLLMQLFQSFLLNNYNIQFLSAAFSYSFDVVSFTAEVLPAIYHILLFSIYTSTSRVVSFRTIGEVHIFINRSTFHLFHFISREGEVDCCTSVHMVDVCRLLHMAICKRNAKISVTYSAGFVLYTW